MYGNERRDVGYINDMQNFIQIEYGLKPTGITPAKRGYYGETWKLDTAEQSYFLKLDYSDAHKHLYEHSFPIIEHLCNHGIDFISRIVKTADGRLSTQYGGAVLGVFEWIDGENIETDETKIHEYQMLAKIYTVPSGGVSIPREGFSADISDKFFAQWDALEDNQICSLLEKNRVKLEHRGARLSTLPRYATMTRPDLSSPMATQGETCS